MNKTILSDALRKRKGKGFDTKGFIREPTKGLDSPDLGTKTAVVLGEGVKDETLLKGANNKTSTDDLSPTRQELEAKGHKIKQTKVEDLDDLEMDDREEKSEVGGNFDDDVFDEKTFEKLKSKKPKTIYERMQLNLGKKKGK